MQPVQNSLTDEQFRRELLNRFFHPKSYFYRCVKQGIDTLVNSSASSNAREYELFDEVFEKIVDSEDKEHDLGVLETIEGFGQLGERLDGGIQYLRGNQLDREGMKIEIENLAQSLIKVGVQALSDDRVETKIQAFLNNQIIPDFDSPHLEGEQDDLQQVEELTTDLGDGLEHETEVGDNLDFMEAIEEPEKSSGEDDQFDEIPLELIEDLNSGPTQDPTASVEEQASETPTEAVVQDPLEAIEHQSPVSNEATNLEEDFLLLVDAGEASSSHKKGALSPPDRASAAVRESESGEGASAHGPKTGSGLQPAIQSGYASRGDGFGLEIETELSQLQKSIDRLRRSPGKREHWASCDSTFDKISAKSMVGGFEGFEEVSTKARNFIAICLRSTTSMDSASVEILSETYQTLITLLQGDIDHVDRETVAAISRKFEKRRRKKRPRTQAKKSPLQTPKTAPVVTEVPSIPESPPIDPVVEAEAPSFPQEQSDFDISKFKLPGEDDDEIISLVNEISEGEENAQLDGTEDSLPQKFDLNVGEDLDFEEPSAVPETPAVLPEESTVPEATVFEPRTTTGEEFLSSAASEADEKLTVYKDQSEFYFNIVQDSFDRLQTDPDDKIALEDLELSSHSLYELSLKLNLEAISSFPAAIEKTVKSLVGRNCSPSGAQLQNLRRAYEYFTQLNSVEQATSPTADSLLAAVDGVTYSVPSDEIEGQRNVDMDDDAFQII